MSWDLKEPWQMETEHCARQQRKGAGRPGLTPHGSHLPAACPKVNLLTSLSLGIVICQMEFLHYRVEMIQIMCVKCQKSA